MENNDNKGNIGMLILSFIIPIVGIFMYFYKLQSSPRYAKQCLILGLAGLAVLFVLAIIFSPMA